MGESGKRDCRRVPPDFPIRRAMIHCVKSDGRVRGGDGRSSLARLMTKSLVRSCAATERESNEYSLSFGPVTVTAAAAAGAGGRTKSPLLSANRGEISPIYLYLCRRRRRRRRATSRNRSVRRAASQQTSSSVSQCVVEELSRFGRSVEKVFRWPKKRTSHFLTAFRSGFKCRYD